MTAAPGKSSRQLACAQCGTVFACNLAGGCWCTEEPYRVPMPETAAQDCLCPACLRKLAAASPDTIRSGAKRSDIP